MANREGVPPLLDALVGHANNLSRMKTCFYRFFNAMPHAKNREQHRRYQQVIETVRSQADFCLDDLKDQLVGQPPEFVVKVVNELASQGWLVRELGVNWKTGRYRWNPDRGEFDLDRWLGQKKQGVRIAETPPSDRPRERLLKMGAENLMTSELLAILIRSGPRRRIGGPGGRQNCQPLRRPPG